jgi:hypothetical protein
MLALMHPATEVTTDAPADVCFNAKFQHRLLSPSRVVEGHAAAHLSPEQEIALSRLAAGNIDDLHGELAPLLGTNRNALI